MKNYLLFDLDGTLSDPKVGICTCVQYALKDFGIEEPDLDKLEPFIGPPLKDSFMEFYQMSEEQAEAAIVKYRERFKDVGLFENTVYEGIPEMLKALSAKGMHLAVASSKPTVFVERILEHFGIRKYFKVVVGSELDGRRVNKDEVVQEALRQLFGEKPIEKDKIYMIGDRKFDVEGAKALGIESVGVTYGYGGMEELKEAKADYIVRSVEELKKFLLRGTEDTPKGLSMRRILQFGLPFITFLLVRQIVMTMTSILYVNLGGKIGPIPVLTYDEEGVISGYTGNGYAFAQIIGFILAIAMIWKFAKFMIEKEKDDSVLLHIKGEPVINYIYLGIVTVAGMLGLNLALSMSGAMAASESYQQVSTMQYSPSLGVGLILYVLVSPLAEELMFRGIIYNCLKRCIKSIPAVILAAAFFGMYHGNSIQGIYAFIMACLMIYAYEYFGDFKVPLAMHMGINFISYLVSFCAVEKLGNAGWIICMAAILAGGWGLVMLCRQKKVF